MAGESKHGKHLRNPISVRLPEPEQTWVEATAESEGVAKNAVIVGAVREKRERDRSQDPATTTPEAKETER